MQSSLLLILTLNGLAQSHFEEVVEPPLEGREVLLNLIVEKLEVFPLQADLSHGQKVFRSGSLPSI